VRIEYGQPIRSAITVAGIVGNACNNSRIRGSNASTTDPTGARQYRGGPPLANARFTVFRATPSTRAISEIDNPSARRSRRTSAQSSTPNTRFLPGSTPARVSGKLVNFRLPRPGQYWAAVDSRYPHCAENISGEHVADVVHAERDPGGTRWRPASPLRR